jgi:hypothetical protein
VDDFGQAPENRRHSRPHDTRQAGGHISWSSGAGRPPGWGRLLEKSKERGHPARDQNPSRASCPILFTWHQIQRTCYGPEGHSQGKSPCVSICNVARASRSCPGRRGRKSRGISSIFARKQPYWASRLSGRRKIHPESASPIPAFPVLRVPPGGGRNAPDGGVKSRWRIEPPTGWKRGRTTGVLARRRICLRRVGFLPVQMPGRRQARPEGKGREIGEQGTELDWNLHRANEMIARSVSGGGPENASPDEAGSSAGLARGRLRTNVPADHSDGCVERWWSLAHVRPRRSDYGHATCPAIGQAGTADPAVRASGKLGNRQGR